ncbi:MAG: AAA family ATPase, partial [Gemmatimonas sp.]
MRKALFGVPPLTRLEPAGYAPVVSRRVYQGLADRASTALGAGHAVIADAVYADPRDREEIAAVARDSGVPFTGFWIEGPREVLAQRLSGRVGDASDATGEVLRHQVVSGT